MIRFHILQYRTETDLLGSSSVRKSPEGPSEQGFHLVQVNEEFIKCASAVMETNHILYKSLPIKRTDFSLLFGTYEASLWSQERQVRLTGKGTFY